MQIVCKQIAILTNSFAVYNNFVHDFFFSLPWKLLLVVRLTLRSWENAESKVSPSNIRDNPIENVGTQLEQNHTEVAGMFAYHFSHYLLSCNSEGKLTPSDGSSVVCVKRGWGLWGVPDRHFHISWITSPVSINWQPAGCRETKQCVALGSEQCFGAGFGSFQEGKGSHLGKCCWNSTEKFMMPLFLQCLLLCSWKSQNCRMFWSSQIIGMIAFTLSHFSTHTVILFCFLAIF